MPASHASQSIVSTTATTTSTVSPVPSSTASASLHPHTSASVGVKCCEAASSTAASSSLPASSPDRIESIQVKLEPLSDMDPSVEEKLETSSSSQPQTQPQPIVSNSASPISLSSTSNSTPSASTSSSTSSSSTSSSRTGLPSDEELSAFSALLLKALDDDEALLHLYKCGCGRPHQHHTTVSTSISSTASALPSTLTPASTTTTTTRKKKRRGRKLSKPPRRKPGASASKTTVLESAEASSSNSSSAAATCTTSATEAPASSSSSRGRNKTSRGRSQSKAADSHTNSENGSERGRRGRRGRGRPRIATAAGRVKQEATDDRPSTTAVIYSSPPFSSSPDSCLSNDSSEDSQTLEEDGRTGNVESERPRRRRRHSPITIKQEPISPLSHFSSHSPSRCHSPSSPSSPLIKSESLSPSSDSTPSGSTSRSGSTFASLSVVSSLAETTTLSPMDSVGEMHEFNEFPSLTDYRQLTGSILVSSTSGGDEFDVNSTLNTAVAAPLMMTNSTSALNLVELITTEENELEELKRNEIDTETEKETDVVRPLVSDSDPLFASHTTVNESHLNHTASSSSISSSSIDSSSHSDSSSSSVIDSLLRLSHKAPTSSSSSPSPSPSPSPSLPPISPSQTPNSDSSLLLTPQRQSNPVKSISPSYQMIRTCFHDSNSTGLDVFPHGSSPPPQSPIVVGPILSYSTSSHRQSISGYLSPPVFAHVKEECTDDLVSESTLRYSVDSDASMDLQLSLPLPLPLPLPVPVNLNLLNMTLEEFHSDYSSTSSVNSDPSQPSFHPPTSLH